MPKSMYVSAAIANATMKIEAENVRCTFFFLFRFCSFQIEAYLSTKVFPDSLSRSAYYKYCTDAY